MEKPLIAQNKLDPRPPLPTFSTAACNYTAARFRRCYQNSSGFLKKLTNLIPPNTQRHETTTANSHLFLGRRALGAGTGLGSFYRRLGHRGRLLATFGSNKRGWRGCACGAYKGRKRVWTRRDTGRHWRFFPARSPPPSLWRHRVYIHFLTLFFLIYVTFRMRFGFHVYS